MNQNFSLDDLIEIFQNHYCTDNIVVKVLAENDNSKNQVYFGNSFEALNLFHNLTLVQSPINDTVKSHLDFSWVLDDGTISIAPYSQLILYPQYPEVRFSGFLKGSLNAPSSLMRERSTDRLLILGISSSGRILGHVTTRDTRISIETLESINQNEKRVFHEVEGYIRSNREQLLVKLTSIHLKGWISGWRLDSTSSRIDCFAPNCGGYTLEAEFGIVPNGVSEPDFLGWELKQYKVSDLSNVNSGGAITLMTPEPDGGLYHDENVESFIRKYGYFANNNTDRMDFAGNHKYNQSNNRTNLTLEIEGFDPETNRITNSRGCIKLVDNECEVAASWSFVKLMEHWNKKHNKAAYVPSDSRTILNSNCRQYMFGNVIRLCETTDFSYYLEAIINSSVYYDPGIKLTGLLSTSTRTKRRNQFRVRASRVPDLYERTEEITLIAE